MFYAETRAIVGCLLFIIYAPDHRAGFCILILSGTFSYPAWVKNSPESAKSGRSTPLYKTLAS